MQPLWVCYRCPERRGLVGRTVTEVEPTLKLEEYLVANFGHVVPFGKLERIYDARSRVFLVDDVGAMFKGPLEFDGLPEVHIAFWDRVLVGREEMCYDVARIVAEDDGALGVWTAIPKDSRATLAFAKRVGFEVVREATTSFALVCLFHDATRRTQWASRQP